MSLSEKEGQAEETIRQALCRDPETGEALEMAGPPVVEGSPYSVLMRNPRSGVQWLLMRHPRSGVQWRHTIRTEEV